MKKIWSFGDHDCLCDSEPPPGVRTLPLSAIALADPGDTVVVPSTELPLASTFQDYLKKKVVRLGDGVVLATEPPVDYVPGSALEVLCFGKEANALSPEQTERYRGTIYWGNKNNFYQVAKEKRWDVPRTVQLTQAPDALLGSIGFYLAQAGMSMQRMVKAALGTGRSEVYYCPDHETLKGAVDRLKGRPFQIQECLEGADFYEIHYDLGEVMVTKRFNGDHHEPHVKPIMNEGCTRLLAAARPVIDLLQAVGIPQFTVEVVEHKGRQLLLGCSPHGTKLVPWRVARKLSVPDDRWEYRRYSWQGERTLPELLERLKPLLNWNAQGPVILLDPAIYERELGVLLIGAERWRRSRHEAIRRALQS